MREHEPEEGYFFGFSGGKDSLVTSELLRMAGVKHEAFYSVTGIDAPEVVQFIRHNYPSVTWLRPKMTFWEGIRRYDPPLRMQRWCCNVLKKDPAKKHPLSKNSVMGIRAEESRARAARGQIDFNPKYKKTTYKPIFNWQEWHVWEFIEQNNLKYPSLYDEGFSRIGCIICPNIMSKNMVQMQRNRDRWPHIYKVFEKVTEQWFAKKRTNNDRYQKHKTAREYLDDYYRGFK